jgi:hypothetical protein
MTEQVQPGDIFLTRNKGDDETVNTSPGYYNHAAIFSVKNWVIEAQAAPNSVIAVPVWNFFERYPEILVLRPQNKSVAIRTAETAPKFLGQGYGLYTSIRPLWRWPSKDNCTSLIRRIYNVVTGYDYRWHIPDSFLKTTWLTKVALKKDYESHIDIEGYKGVIKVWNDTEAIYIR